MQELLEDVREKVDDGEAHEVRVRKAAHVRVLDLPVPGLPEDARGAPPVEEA